ncbi:MAG: 3'-5' exonuclease [Candidatus Rickettsiella isopodorum]|mgnify:CR=1 FL=1|jgi:3'-5' exonuclease|nr:3'-5' exonuclease [Gammaproteobacteria bacterium]MCH9755375.1 3'-5' exonuclease [Gammaproteobacteria bacterium]MDD4893245.1 3'-5' exonuclease [Candidatus Rickettsiella isopodorum]MDD5162143.1 3'-5' exonuclease [Candidatus Rickettsiella isopodorum]MDQ5899734.1 3-5 exonuclease [Pseudomonadota bacterium]
MNTFVFDIETVPDTKNGRILYNLESEKSDRKVAETMQAKRQEKTGNSDFLPYHLQRIVAISVALHTKNQFKIGSLGNINSDEPVLIEAFFKCIEKYLPILISWNGSGFDLPVLHYRALLYGISSPSYWNIGNEDASFRWNNYLSRYHYRHMDLMDILAAYQGRANAPLTEIAIMLGLPGKLGMDGSQVWDYFLNGKLDAIRNYCETDVLNTYLIYLRFELIRGNFSVEAYQKKCAYIYETIAQENKPHFKQFIAAWKI